VATAVTRKVARSRTVLTALFLDGLAPARAPIGFVVPTATRHDPYVSSLWFGVFSPALSRYQVRLKRFKAAPIWVNLRPRKPLRSRIGPRPLEQLAPAGGLPVWPPRKNNPN